MKIRIAVAITPDGEWNSSGWGRPGKTISDKDMMDNAIEGVKDGETQYFIEAEIPLPETKTIQAAIAH